MKTLKVKVYRKYLVWRVKLVGGNGEIVMNSEAYASKRNAQRAAKRLTEEIKPT